VLGLAAGAVAQTAPAMHAEPAVAMSASVAMNFSDLPDAPEAAIQPDASLRIAPRYHLDIQAGETAQTLDVRQKYVLAAYQDVNLGAAALTQAYYPAPSRGAGAVFRGYGGSLGGVALGFGYHEFLGDALRIAHLKRD